MLGMHSLPYQNVKVQASYVADRSNMYEWFLRKNGNVLGESVSPVAEVGYIVLIAYEVAVISLNVVASILYQVLLCAAQCRV